MIYNMKKSFRAIPSLTRSLAKLATSCDDDALIYCTNIVRQYDYENFLATLLMTKAIRTPALVVRAFNVEVARVQDQTTEAETAALRLRFWKDALENIFSKDQTQKIMPANPIIQELYKVSSCYQLPKRHLEKLITSRNHLLKSKYFRRLEDVESYAEDTVSSIYYLILKVAGIASIHADHVASHLGKAQGLANILRSIRVANTRKTVTLPMDVLMRNGVSQETVLRGVDSENMRSVAFEIASRANNHLVKARSITVQKEAHQIFLPATAVEAYLKKLQKNNFNVFDMSLQLGNNTLPFRLYYKRLLNKF